MQLPGPNKKPTPKFPSNVDSHNRNATIPVHGGQSLIHQRLTIALVNECKNRGLQVLTASLLGFPEPRKIGRHAPDLVAKDNLGNFYVGESKTGEGDLTTPHTLEQLTDFASCGAQFYLVVPQAALPEAERVLKALGIYFKPNVHLLHLIQ